MPNPCGTCGEFSLGLGMFQPGMGQLLLCFDSEMEAAYMKQREPDMVNRAFRISSMFVGLSVLANVITSLQEVFRADHPFEFAPGDSRSLWFGIMVFGYVCSAVILTLLSLRLRQRFVGVDVEAAIIVFYMLFIICLLVMTRRVVDHIFGLEGSAEGFDDSKSPSQDNSVMIIGIIVHFLSLVVRPRVHRLLLPYALTCAGVFVKQLLLGVLAQEVIQFLALCALIYSTASVARGIEQESRRRYLAEREVGLQRAEIEDQRSQIREQQHGSLSDLQPHISASGPEARRKDRRSKPEPIRLKVGASSSLPIVGCGSSFRKKFGAPPTFLELLPQDEDFPRWLVKMADDTWSGHRDPGPSAFGHVQIGPEMTTYLAMATCCQPKSKQSRSDYTAELTLFLDAGGPIGSGTGACASMRTLSDLSSTGTASDTSSLQSRRRVPERMEAELAETSHVAVDTSILQVLTRWNLPMARTSCCRFHCAAEVAKYRLQKLMKEPCIGADVPWPRGNMQCRQCGMMGTATGPQPQHCGICASPMLSISLSKHKPSDADGSERVHASL